MRTLYFDLDGTVVTGFGGVAKTLLAEGGFERAVRAAGCSRLVCVGNAVAIFQSLARMGQDHDGIGTVFRLCQGAFLDEAWLRSVLELTPIDPHRRVEGIDRGLDWLYVDDLAEQYCRDAGAEELFSAERGRRILRCDPEGDGQDVLAWLEEWKVA
ncbi:MAG TPA: hypothetical protein DEA08_38560 [Planctomycetes bacterium]|nr:hypothetical protein [Planctomycetota bacterium]